MVDGFRRKDEHQEFSSKYLLSLLSSTPMCKGQEELHIIVLEIVVQLALNAFLPGIRRISYSEE